MGLGGYLMWTGVGREIWKRTGLKMLPVETHGIALRMIDSPVFYNNPYFIQPGEKFEYIFPLILNNPDTNYCKQDTPTRAIHRYDKHIIQQVCEFYNIEDPQVRCDLFLTDDEKMFVDDFRSDICREKFIAIEPHTKDEYTVNKSYPFDKWQKVVNDLLNHVKIVQVGQKTDKILNGCIDMTGSTSFREAAAIISEAELFIGPEGGLMHAANAADTLSVVVITGFIHPRMTCYSENKNLWVGRHHGPCGLKSECENCKKECNLHDYREIVNIAKESLGI
tara:strand:+ start:70 stop:906 length:837 start_codon:yes stop_codon:yes gene_type:complete